MSSRVAAIRVRPLVALLHHTRKQPFQTPGARQLSFLPSSRRPRLPYLLGSSTPHTTNSRPTPHPQPSFFYRLISAKTKEYLWRESLIAARIVVFGYTAIFVAGCLAFAAAIGYAEKTDPTPGSLRWDVRLGISIARVLLEWVDSHRGAIMMLKDAIDTLERQGWNGKDSEWRKGYITALKLLAEIEEENDLISEAREHYQRIANTPRESKEQEKHWVDMKQAATLRLSRLAEFQKDPDAAEAALRKAISITLPPQPSTETPAAGELPVLPSAESVENSPLLLKAVTELAIFYARHDKKVQALELFTRVLVARRNVAPPRDPTDSKSAEVLSDPCAEAVVMMYIGEVIFAMGDKKQGVAWSKEAYGRSEPLAKHRGACKECALVAARNIRTMMARMEGMEKKWSWWRPFESAKGEVEEDSMEEWDKAVMLMETIRTTRGP